MARKDDGEFELILGNRQLISVFLIVVILLGVFFSMGYIVGRNTTPAAVAENGSPAAAAKALVIENSPKAAVLPGEPASTPLPSPPVSAPHSSKPSPVQSGERTVETRRDEQKRPASKAAEPENNHTASVGEPVPGQYLQVVATGRADAEIVAESLLKKGFKAMVAPVPGSALHRVLVGPFQDAASMSETRERLAAAGFKPYVRRY